MPRVFLNYRREDSEGIAGRIFDRLRDRFGPENVFRDLDTIAPGAEFARVIGEEIAKSDALIAIIGNDWLEAKDPAGKRRLESPRDFVRTEISEALSRKKLVIPTLVEGASMPSAKELPTEIALLAERNAIEISAARFEHDMERLVKGIAGERQVAATSSRWPWISDPNHQRTLGFLISRVKNHPAVALVIVLGTIVIALSTFTDAAKNLIGLITTSPEAARTKLSQIPLEYTPEAFVASAKKGDLHAVNLFITAGIDPNTMFKGNTVLMYAAREGHVPIINALLKARAHINAENEGGVTALSWAAAAGNIDTLRVLLDNGANAEAINEAFVTAAASGRRDVMRILLDRGADVKKLGSAALLAAARSGIAGVTDKELSDTARFMLELGTDVNAKDEEGWTPLLFAVQRGYAVVVQTLLEKGADVNAKCDCRGWLGGGWTALMIAIQRRHSEIVEALLSKGPDVNTRNHRGQTALSLAMEQGDEGLVKAMRDKGAAGIIGASLSSEAVNAMLVKHDFYDKTRNASGRGIAHKYEPQAIRDAVVVIDHATRLMWQKGGSEQMTLDEAEDYISRLNDERFAGFSDWRLPTLEEAMSLMEPQAYDAFHIAPIFQRGVNFIWTADRTPEGRGWMLYFYDGILDAERPEFNAWVRAVRSNSTPLTHQKETKEKPWGSETIE